MVGGRNRSKSKEFFWHEEQEVLRLDIEERNVDCNTVAKSGMIRALRKADAGEEKKAKPPEPAKAPPEKEDKRCPRCGWVKCRGKKEDEEVEVAGGKRLKIPKTPSPEERAKHEKNHLPWRSWCEACVRGKGKEGGHYRKKEEKKDDDGKEKSKAPVAEMA